MSRIWSGAFATVRPIFAAIDSRGGGTFTVSAEAAIRSPSGSAGC